MSKGEEEQGAMGRTGRQEAGEQRAGRHAAQVCVCVVVIVVVFVQNRRE